MCRLLCLFQHETLDFACRRFGQGLSILNISGIFVRGNRRLDVILQPLRQPVRICAIRQNHMGLHDHTALRIRHADHGTFGHSWMGKQSGFNLGSRDIVARGDNHIVVAGGKMQVAICVHAKRIARDVPAIQNISLLLFRPQIAAACRDTHC